jgi:hypothetical protein
MTHEVETLKPLARELSRELTLEEIDAVTGAGGTLPGTIAIDQHYDSSGDRRLAE